MSYDLCDMADLGSHSSYRLRPSARAEETSNLSICIKNPSRAAAPQLCCEESSNNCVGIKLSFENSGRKTRCANREETIALV